MSANTTAQVMIESMVRIAQEEFETGNYAKAIDTATNLIQAIETNHRNGRDRCSKWCLNGIMAFRGTALL